jgi:hypothetical protein
MFHLTVCDGQTAVAAGDEGQELAAKTALPQVRRLLKRLEG